MSKKIILISLIFIFSLGVVKGEWEYVGEHTVSSNGLTSCKDVFPSQCAGTYRDDTCIVETSSNNISDGYNINPFFFNNKYRTWDNGGGYDAGTNKIKCYKWNEYNDDYIWYPNDAGTTTVGSKTVCNEGVVQIDAGSKVYKLDDPNDHYGEGEKIYEFSEKFPKVKDGNLYNYTYDANGFRLHENLVHVGNPVDPNNISCFSRGNPKPQINNISLTLDHRSPGEFVLANDIGDLSVDIEDDSIIPITLIKYNFENVNDENSFLGGEINIDPNNGSIGGDIFNISKVDNYINNDGYRNYTFKITKVCNELGGEETCWGTNEISYWDDKSNEYEWGVVSAKPNELILQDNFSELLVANNSDVFNGEFVIEDEYNNKVVPIGNINRKIELNWVYDNHVYLDQMKRTGKSGIKYELLGDSAYSFANTGNNNFFSKSYNDFDLLKNNSNKYNISIKSYVPTNVGYNKAIGNISINDLKVKVVDDLLGSEELNKNIGNNLSFKPIIKGKINNLVTLAPEGQKGNFDIVDLNIDELDLDGDNDYINEKNNVALQLYYDSDNNPIKPILGKDNNISYTGDYGGNVSMFFSNSSSNFNSFGFDDISNFNSLDLTSNSYINDLYHKFEVETGNFLSGVNNRGSLYSYYIYNYDDIDYARWRSDSRSSSDGSRITKDIGVYIDGLVSIDDLGKKHQMLTGVKRNINISMSRSDLKNQVYKQVHKIIKGKEVSVGQTDFDSNDLIEDCYRYNNCFKYSNSLIYYIDGDDIELDSIDNVDKNIIFISDGGNIKIKNDLNPNGNGNIALIALRNKNDVVWDASGNIFIDVNTTQVNSLIYGDGSMMSYNGALKGYNINHEDLRNQLYIKGVLRTFNTLGGANGEKPCPYFVDDCTDNLARSFDLEYGRTFHLVSADLMVDTNIYPDAENYWLPVANDSNYSKQAKLAGGKDFCKYNGSDLDCESVLFDGDVNKNNLKKDDTLKSKFASIYIKYDSDVLDFPIFGDIID